MIEHRVKGLHQLLLLGQIALLVTFFWLWRALWLGLNPADTPILNRSYLVYCLLMVAGVFTEAQSRKWDTAGAYEKSWLKQLPVTLRQIVFAIGALLIFLVVAKDRFISRSFLLTMIPGLYLLLLAGNHWMPRLLCRLIFRSACEGRILLVGDYAKAAKLKSWLRRKAEFGFQTAGILCENKSEVHGFLAPEATVGPQSPPQDLPILGRPSDIGRHIAGHSISHVVLLDNPGTPGFDHRLIRITHAQGARLLVLSDIDEVFQQPVSIVDEDGLKFFTFYREPLQSPINRALKRSLDIAISLPVLVLVLPPACALVWAAQRRQSPGPIFHRQSRAGIQNRVFTLLKFRTMHEGKLDETPATRNDARVFRFGRWLRRFSLDELPQFVNVLRGEMSVVGPRPHLVAHNAEFARVMDHYHVRAFVKPGVTGLAQVRGFRGETKSVEDIAARLQSDMVYLENWSLLLDGGIMLRTVWQMFFPPPTAY